MEVGVTVMVADGVAKVIGVGDINIIFIAPSSGTGDKTFFPVKTTAIITTMRKNPMMIPVAATVFVRSSIPPNNTTNTRNPQIR